MTRNREIAYAPSQRPPHLPLSRPAQAEIASLSSIFGLPLKIPHIYHSPCHVYTLHRRPTTREDSVCRHSTRSRAVSPLHISGCFSHQCRNHYLHPSTITPVSPSGGGGAMQATLPGSPVGACSKVPLSLAAHSPTLRICTQAPSLSEAPRNRSRPSGPHTGGEVDCNKHHPCKNDAVSPLNLRSSIYVNPGMQKGPLPKSPFAIGNTKPSPLLPLVAEFSPEPLI